MTQIGGGQGVGQSDAVRWRPVVWGLPLGQCGPRVLRPSSSSILFCVVPILHDSGADASRSPCVSSLASCVCY